MPERVEHQASGRLNREIANAVVRLHSEHIGRGPTKAQAFYRGNVVVVVLQDAQTTGERTLVAHGREAAVHDLREHLQESMRADLVTAVEALTGCRVEALLASTSVVPDLVSQVFVLDRPVPGESADH